MKTINEDLAEEITRRRALAKHCRALAADKIGCDGGQDWADAARHDNIADEIEALLLTKRQGSDILK